MKNSLPYDPTNIESLLIHKHYYELTESEKEFVMKEITSESEYESLRSTLNKIRSSFDEEEELVPESDIRSSLLAQFEQRSKQRKGAGWWKSLFPEGKGLLLSPGFQLASLAVMVTTIGIFYFNSGSNKQDENIAQNKSETIIPEEEEIETISPATDSKAENIAIDDLLISEKPKDETVLLDETEKNIIATEEKNISQRNKEIPVFTEPVLAENEIADRSTTNIETDSYLQNRADNLAKNDKLKAEKKSEEQAQSRNIAVTGSTSMNKDKENLSRDENSSRERTEQKAKKSVGNTKTLEDEVPQNGVPASSNPQVLDLLFTAL